LGARRKHSALSAWLARHSAEQVAVFDFSVRELGIGYEMLSVVLSDGLVLCAAGEFWKARGCARLCADVAERHAAVVAGTLRVLERRSRHYGLVPEVHALDSEDFCTAVAKSKCSWNRLLHLRLFGLRGRWFHKLLILQEIFEEVSATFTLTARELADGTSISSRADWDTLKLAYIDWNTCMQETTILLRCLLTMLAPGEVRDLRRELQQKFEQQQQVEAQRPSEWREMEEAEEETSHPEGRPYL